MQPALFTTALPTSTSTVFKRLGFLLESLEIPAPELIQACRESISKGLSFLDPSVDHPGTICKRWNLRVNVKVEP